LKAQSRGKSKQIRKQYKHTEYWKVMVSRPSGIWGNYYLTNIFL